MKPFDSQSEFDETLRLLAKAQAPEGLAGRVQDRLQAAPAASRWRRIFFVSPQPRGRLWNAVAAAVAALVVIGIGWAVLSLTTLRSATRATAPQVAPEAKSGFSAAGAIRKPATVQGPAAPQSSQIK